LAQVLLLMAGVQWNRSFSLSHCRHSGHSMARQDAHVACVAAHSRAEHSKAGAVLHLWVAFLG
jgi:hypothetical protein